MNSAKVARISEVEPFDALAGLMEMFSGGGQSRINHRAAQRAQDPETVRLF
ncbi:hypothetical protein [Pseudomonas sp. NMI542_15]|uniref:hypothetical protein n=1 Tax=Pseudomonas sp. NMI542_15 TaxID=2903148 RepID=UPI001E4FC700|nr:hypothetical protein [Pseudomonas sp. NMI542_15]MCE0780230.1 hypothetical protein [Pseudomonas sp. NMI542_15]